MPNHLNRDMMNTLIAKGKLIANSSVLIKYLHLVTIIAKKCKRNTMCVVQLNYCSMKLIM